VYRLAQEPLDPSCGCTTCVRFTRAYLHHLVRVREPVSAQLLSVHNLFFYRTLMERMRAAILARSFQRLYQHEAPILGADDCDNPPRAPAVRSRQQPRMERGAYRVVVRPGVAGGEPFGVVQHTESGETMHAQSDPYAEAYGLYVAQPGLVELVAARSDTPLVIWDVGMGAAMNVMACIRKLEAIDRFERPVQIVSFEHDLDPLRLATGNPTVFAHVRHRAPHAILRTGEWCSGVAPVMWRLQLGDLRAYAEQAPQPDIVWYDPFSYKVEPGMWTVGTFERLLAATRGGATTLYTYSASTAVRVSMLVAGWYVGYGAGTGMKRETTVAFTPAAVAAGQARQLLDEAWLRRWERSQAAEPLIEAGAALPKVQVLHHPQFQSLAGLS
jgi:queuine tRNA-ribosyltransferase